MMKHKSHWIAWALAIALLVLHHDFWRGPRPGLWFGFLPEELAYRLVWMALCFIYLLVFTAVVWKGDDA